MFERAHVFDDELDLLADFRVDFLGEKAIVPSPSAIVTSTVRAGSVHAGFAGCVVVFVRFLRDGVRYV